MGQALYRKYRSRSLGEVVGQHHVTDILTRALAQGRIAHAYLLTGPKGVGKTSIARILAHEINQLPYSDESTHLDIIEIDAASNNGIDDIRDLREKVQLAPVSAAKKVYIIDEVHMLSKAAFNALLKTLEEPPEHVVFILATTDADKLPATIISRTQRFGFRAITPSDTKAHLKMIAEKEKISIDDAALEIIAERGGGSFRDSISLLDQLASLADGKTGITRELVETSLGLAPHELVAELLDAVKAHDQAAVIAKLTQFDESGVQPSILTSQLISTIRASLGEAPQLVSLLDSLLDVPKSSHPSVKLLTVLLQFAAPKAKSAALAAPAPIISAPIKKLEQKTPEKPMTSSSVNLLPTEVSMPTPTGVARKGGKTVDGTSEQKAQKSSPDKKTKSEKTVPLDWPKLLEHVKKHHIALHSVVSKCTPEEHPDKLVLYTQSVFYKRKLDDTKYRPLLAQSIADIGCGNPHIETIPTPPPPKDSQAAAVAAIMGGGEEVTI